VQGEGVDSVEQVVEVGAGGLPGGGFGDRVVAGLEGGRAVADLVEVGDAVRADDRALDGGEVDLGLVQPGRGGGAPWTPRP
jgi:hypothetical protein